MIAGEGGRGGSPRQSRGLASSLIIVGVLLVGLLPQTPFIQAAPLSQDATGAKDVIVVLDEGVDPEAAAAELGVEPTYVYDDVINGFAARLPQRALDAAKRRRDVLEVTEDFRVRKFAQVVPTGVDRIDAEKSENVAIPEVSGAINVDIAILDTGITRGKDLNVPGGKSCIGGNRWRDRDGHGTHVAGIAAARDNNREVVGVAPGARLWAVKVLDDRGDGTWSSVICGLDWVYNHRARIDVVNMSLGGFGNEGDCSGTALHRAVCFVVNRGGIPIVAAAGNSGTNADRFVPASFKEVITVSAFADSDGKPGGTAGPCRGEADDGFASYSNFGQDIDIAAPGNCIRSTRQRRGTRVLSGTSMAAPHVTGAIGLYLSQNPGASVAEVRSWLLTAASCPQGSDAGFNPATDPDGSSERVLYLGASCDAPNDIP